MTLAWTALDGPQGQQFDIITSMGVARAALLSLSAISSAGIANVKDFGAVGNGVANDTAAIQAAFNSGLPAVYFPGGVYLSGAIGVPANVTRVFGDGATVKQVALGADLFDIPATTRLLFENLLLAGIPGNVNTITTNNGIAASACSGIRVVGCVFQNFRGLALAFTSVTDFEITGNLFTGNSQDSRFQACQRGRIHHNEYTTPQFTGFVSSILLDFNSGGQGNTDLTIDHNEFIDYTNTHNIYVHTLLRGVIIGNVCKNTTLGIAIGGPLAVGDIIDKVLVAGNVIDCALAGTSGNGNVGISIESGNTQHITNVTVVGNQITNANAVDLSTTLGGISCGYVDGLDIVDNTIISPRAAGIAIENPVTRFNCRGNTIRDVVNVAGIRYGIYFNTITGGCSGLCEGNWIDGGATKGIVISVSQTGVKMGRNRFTGVGSGNHYVNPSFATPIEPITSSGTVTITNPNAAITVVFPEVEGSSTYKRGATVRSSTAGGGVGPYVLQTGSPTANGFAIFLNAAPSAGNSVDVDWWINYPDDGA